QDIGKEPLQGPSVAALAKELLTPDEVLALRVAPKTVRVDHDGDAVDVLLAVEGTHITMTIKRARAPLPRRDSGASAAVVAKDPPPKQGSMKHPIDEILHDMISRKASDLHLSAGAVPVMRIHGEVHFMKDRPALTSDAILALMKPLFNEKA